MITLKLFQNQVLTTSKKTNWIHDTAEFKHYWLFVKAGRQTMAVITDVQAATVSVANQSANKLTVYQLRHCQVFFSPADLY